MTTRRQDTQPAEESEMGRKVNDDAQADTQPAEEIAEVKSAVITAEALKSGRIRVAGLRGDFHRAHFDDDGVSERPVGEETREALRTQFPGVVIEEVE
jgi:hypothetical protein